MSLPVWQASGPSLRSRPGVGVLHPRPLPCQCRRI